MNNRDNLLPKISSHKDEAKLKALEEKYHKYVNLRNVVIGSIWEIKYEIKALETKISDIKDEEQLKILNIELESKKKSYLENNKWLSENKSDETISKMEKEIETLKAKIDNVTKQQAVEVAAEAEAIPAASFFAPKSLVAAQESDVLSAISNPQQKKEMDRLLSDTIEALAKTMLRLHENSPETDERLVLNHIVEAVKKLTTKAKIPVIK